MKKIKILAYMVKQVLEISPPYFRRRLPLLFCFMMISSVLELLSVALVVPFISAIMDTDALMVSPRVVAICGGLGIHNENSLVLLLAVVLVVAFVIKNIALFLTRKYQNDYTIDLRKALSTKLLQSYLSRPYSFFLQSNTGALAGRIEGDTGGILAVLNAFLAILAETITVLFLAAYIFSTDPVMAIGVLMVAFFCVIFITLVLKRKIAVAGQMSYQAHYENTMELLQALNGIKEITVMRRRDHFVRSYKKTYDEMAQGDKRFLLYNMMPERFIEVFFVSSVILIVTFRALLGTDAAIYISKMAAFAMAAYRILPSMSKYTAGFNTIIQNQPPVDSGYRAVKEAENYHEELSSQSEETVESEARMLSYLIEVKDLTFRYRSDYQPVLDGLQLTIHKGEAVGLIGESGAGKSTLADVILGLLVPECGGVYMDGKEIRTIPISWSRNIGYVPQTVYLVDGSVRDNVGFGLERDQIDDEAIWSALERAQLKEFVMGLNGGLDAHVGERGVRLSGGQRQRIAIARALYVNPTILVLDEATSALDNETEAAIMESIEHLIGSVTLLIIAHRMTTIRKCDTIYEIRDGKAIIRTKEEVGLG